MNKILLFSIVLTSIGFYSTHACACIGSDCKPCPTGFTVTQKCCKSTDSNDCVIIRRDKIEDCGKGEWKEYPRSLPIETKECCTDESENNCRLIPFKEVCGERAFLGYPYSPIKKCCKEGDDNDCVMIRAKRKCGEHQMKDYPEWTPDCCNSLLNKCTGHVKDCPKCL